MPVVAAARLESDVDYRRVANGKRGKIAGADKKLGVSGIYFTSRERLFEIFGMGHGFLLIVWQFAEFPKRLRRPDRCFWRWRYGKPTGLPRRQECLDSVVKL